MNLSTWSIRHPVPPIALFLVLMVAGLYSFRSLAVTESHQKRGIGALLVESCLDEAASLEIGKVFVLTYQAGFFRKMGFVDTDKQNLPHKIWSDCLHCPKFPDCDEDALIHTNTGPHTGG